MSLLLLMSSGGTQTAYTLTCSAGSYVFAGQSAILNKNSVLVCSAGSYAISGQSAILTKTYLLTCQAGVYVISGQSAILTKASVLVCQAGAYAIAGQSAILKKDSVLVCQSGAYAISGQPASLSHGYVLTCQPGAYTITGNPAVLINHDVPGLVRRPDRPLKTKRKTSGVRPTSHPSAMVATPEPKRTTRRIAVIKSLPVAEPAQKSRPPELIPLDANGAVRFWGVANMQVNVFARPAGNAYFGGHANLQVNTPLNAVGSVRFGGEANIRVVPNDDDEAIALAMHLLSA